MLLMIPLQCIIRYFTLITVNLTFFGIDGQTKSIGKVDLVEYYENSDQFKSIQGKLEPIVDSAVMGSRRNGKTPSYATGFFWQVNFLTQCEDQIECYDFSSSPLRCLSLLCAQ